MRFRPLDLDKQSQDAQAAKHAKNDRVHAGPAGRELPEQDGKHRHDDDSAVKLVHARRKVLLDAEPEPLEQHFKHKYRRKHVARDLERILVRRRLTVKRHGHDKHVEKNNSCDDDLEPHPAHQFESGAPVWREP